MDKIRAKHSKIAVIGDLMIDHYIWGKCERISPEAPVQIVEMTKENSVLGGAGNVINNLKALDCEVSVYTVLGDDNNAKYTQILLDEIGIDKHIIINEKGRITTKKSRVIASNQQIIRFDDETKDDISVESQNRLLNKLSENISTYDIILLSDYGKGVLTTTFTKEIIALANTHNKFILVDPKGLNYSKYKGATLLTPNKKEASLATNIEIKDEKTLQEAGFKLKNKLELKYGIITLSEDGIAIFEENMKVIPTVTREVYDVTGAGDTVLASLGVALSSGLSIQEASEFANKAAAVVVAKVGSATATLNEIEEYEHSLNKGQAESKIKDFKQIKRIAKRLRVQGRKIVFTNGCFDILHVGHVKYLEEAKSYGDTLILGLNSDESVSRLKGPTRPVNSEEDRAYILASLEAVDYVVKFYDDTPFTLIEAVKPHILVKGGDYEGKKVVGEEIADELRLVEFVDGKSTTKTINKIKAG